MSSILKVDEIQNTDGKTGLVITPDGSIDSIKFPEEANSNGRTVTSNTMSSYEEGEWTGKLNFFVSSTGSLAYSHNTLRYIKIGNLVSFFGSLSWSANNFSASSGALCLTGLPFTGAGDNSKRGGANIHYANTAWTGLTIYQQAFREEISETKMTFNFSKTPDGNMSGTTSDYTNISNSGTLFLSGSYFTDE
jgi:hypothetical protein